MGTGQAGSTLVEQGGAQEIATKIRDLGPWFHNMQIGGVETAPEHFLGNYPAVKFARFREAIPEDLSGKTVLDIGCNGGFYSMEMKRRGASRVLGIDSSEFYLKQARFAAEIEGIEVEFRQVSVWDLASLGEKFDLVIFMGVFYHLRYPLLALDLIHEHVAKDLVLFQSMQRGSKAVGQLAKDYDFNEVEIFYEASYPKMHFVEQKYSNDGSNWWIPNRACVEAMLRSSGFSVLQQPEEEVYLCKRIDAALPEDVPQVRAR